ncbi:MAG: hypothetical protein SWO11_03210 [Thermodesulfobacteriota bacterium]|nr:hypothetical protein [Thermodesulfobacteriota bacterium]
MFSCFLKRNERRVWTIQWLITGISLFDAVDGEMILNDSGGNGINPMKEIIESFPPILTWIRSSSIRTTSMMIAAYPTPGQVIPRFYRILTQAKNL